MKSIITNIFLIILSVSFADSQILKAYGIKVGAAAATQTFDYSINFSLPTENRWGLDIGGFAEFFQIPYFSLLTEVHYIQKGYSNTVQESTPAQPAGTGKSITIRPRLDYLSIPVLGKVRFETDVVTP